MKNLELPAADWDKKNGTWELWNFPQIPPDVKFLKFFCKNTANFEIPRLLI